jgi:hypothetical protein
MDSTGISNSLIQQINNSATRTGDAVSITMMRKALDIQTLQATQLIESVARSTPDPTSRIGQNIDIKV